MLAYSLTPELMGKWMIECLKTTWFCPKVAVAVAMIVASVFAASVAVGYPGKGGGCFGSEKIRLDLIEAAQSIKARIDQALSSSSVTRWPF